MARVIVRAIRNGDPPGRFLKKDEKTGKWIDIGDKKAAEKTSQALREKTGEEKDKSNGTAFQSPTLLVPGPVVAAVDLKKESNGDKKDSEGPKEESDAKDAMEVDGDKKAEAKIESVEV